MTRFSLRFDSLISDGIDVKGEETIQSCLHEE